MKWQGFVLKITSSSLLPSSRPNSQSSHIPNSKDPTLLRPSPPSHNNISDIGRLNPLTPIRERDILKQWNPLTMCKEMINNFFLLQTHRAFGCTTKISSFKHVFRRNLAYGGRSSKETYFCGSFRLPNGLGSKITTIQGFKLCGTKTLNAKPARLTNCKYYRLPNH